MRTGISLSLCCRALAVGLLLAGPLLLPLGHWLGVGLLALVGLARWRQGAAAPGQRRDLALPRMLLTLAAAWEVSGLWHGGLKSVLPAALMALGCVLALRGLRMVRPRLAWLWSSLVVAGVGSGATGAWLRWEEGHSRVRGLWEVNAILFGNIALLAGLLCLAGMLWAWQRPRRAWWLTLLAAGAPEPSIDRLRSGTGLGAADPTVPRSHDRLRDRKVEGSPRFS